MEPQNHAPFVQASAGHTISLGRREKKPEKTKKRTERKSSPGVLELRGPTPFSRRLMHLLIFIKCCNKITVKL